jgi:hypothetical protein
MKKKQTKGGPKENQDEQTIRKVMIALVMSLIDEEN